MPAQALAEQNNKTMVYTVDLGNGHVMDIEGPDGATPEQLQAVAAQHPAAPGKPGNQGDQSTTTGDAMEGGFADQHPETPKSKLSPEDEAHYVSLLHTGNQDDINQFLASKGRSTDQDWLSKFIQARDNRKQNGGRVNYGVSYAFPDPKQIDPERIGGGAGAMTRGALDTITLGAAPKIGAAVRAIGDGGNGQSFGDNYNYEHDLGVGVRQQDHAEHPWTTVSGQLLGGMALPAGLEGVGLKAGTDVLKAGGTMAEARAAVGVAVRNRMAAVSGGYGAAHGALSADSPGDAVAGAVTEGALGAATGGVLGQITPTSKAAAQTAAAIPEGRQVFEAGQRQGIDVLPADVAGPVVRRATSMTAQTIAGGQPIIAASTKMTEQAGQARDRIAAAVGHALQPEAAGNEARAGALKYISDSGAQARGYYTSAERAADGVRIDAPKALAELDKNIAALKETPGGAPGLSTLESIRSDLASGKLTVPGIRNMRTVLRDQFIKDGLRGSDLERRVGLVTDAAAQDVTDGLVAAGKPDAAALFARGDKAWRDRVKTIDTVIEPLIGSKGAPRSGEQVIKTLMADLQGNNARAVKFLNTLPPAEQANTRASIIGALGRANSGGQNAEGDAFSLATFLTHWDKIGESAKAAYFGPESRAALNDLAKVAQGAREAQAYANRSNTGGVVGNLAMLASGVGGITSFIATNGSAYGLGRLLASPRFARWLARAPRTQLAPTAYVERLSRIARAEPAIANEVLQLQQRLESVFSSSPARVAADPASNSVGQGQGNAGDQQPQNESLQP